MCILIAWLLTTTGEYQVLIKTSSFLKIRVGYSPTVQLRTVVSQLVVTITKKLLGLIWWNLVRPFKVSSYKMRFKISQLQFIGSISNICRMANKVQNKNYLTYSNETSHSHSWFQISEWDFKINQLRQKRLCVTHTEWWVKKKAKIIWLKGTKFDKRFYDAKLQNGIEN